MLLSDRGLQSAMNRGDLTITPYEPGLVQPASYDVTLSGIVAVQVAPDRTAIADPNAPDQRLWREVRVARDRYLDLAPGMFALASTVEYVKLSPAVAARVEGRSTLGRCGLAIHTTAGWIDPGFEGTVTLELSVVGTVPVQLRPGMRIGQLAVFLCNTPSGRPYGSPGLGSHYQDQRGPATPRA